MEIMSRRYVSQNNELVSAEERRSGHGLSVVKLNFERPHSMSLKSEVLLLQYGATVWCNNHNVTSLC